MANEIDRSWQQKCMWISRKTAYALYTTWEDREQGDIFGNWISKDVGITQTICVVTSFSVENMEFTNRKKSSGPACLLFLEYLNPTFLSLQSMPWPLLCWRRIYEALLNSFSLLSFSHLSIIYSIYSDLFQWNTSFCSEFTWFSLCFH